MGQQPSKASELVFENIGGVPSTYVTAFNVEYRNIDLVERVFMAAIFRGLWEGTGWANMMGRIERASCIGLECVARCSIQILEQFFDPSYFTYTLLAQEDQDDHKCPICLGEFQHNDDIVATVCNHVFHQQCLLQWAYKNSGKESCPCCRASVDCLRCGGYDKATGRIIADKIRVVCAVPRNCNKWKVVQLEYQKDTAQNRGHPDFYRVIVDTRVWNVLRSDENGEIEFPPAQIGVLVPHPHPARYKDWVKEISGRELFVRRNHHRKKKANLLQKFPPVLEQKWNLVEGFVLATEAERLYALCVARHSAARMADKYFERMLHELQPFNLYPYDWCWLAVTTIVEQEWWLAWKDNPDSMDRKERPRGRATGKRPSVMSNINNDPPITLPRGIPLRAPLARYPSVKTSPQMNTLMRIASAPYETEGLGADVFNWVEALLNSGISSNSGTACDLNAIAGDDMKASCVSIHGSGSKIACDTEFISEWEVDSDSDTGWDWNSSVVIDIPSMSDGSSNAETNGDVWSPP